MSKDLLFSITMADCDLATFSSGGPGGQNVNRRSTGVRITHRASGAIGKATDERSQLANKRLAFKRMTETVAFKFWLNQKLAQDSGKITPEQKVEEDMQPENLKIETHETGEWK